MPSYFYHLAIEIFARPLSEPGTAPSYAHEQSSTSLSFDSACEALLPFQKARGQSQQLSRRSRDNRSRYPSSSSSSSSLNLPVRPLGGISGSTAGTVSTAPTPATPRPPPLYTKSHSAATEIEQDQRLDQVSIECIDMVAPREQEGPATTTTTTTTTSSKRPSSHRRVHFKNPINNSVATGIGTDILGGLRTKGRYIPLDQKTSDSVWGIVHLYRDAQETPYLIEEGDYPSELKGSSAAARQTDRLGPGTEMDGREGGRNSNADGSGSGSGGGDGDDGCTTLCILAVPSYLSPSDFLGFVGETTMDDVSHFRMIRTARANRYMVLMKFRSGKKAREWQRVWNGKVFNSMEVCSSFTFQIWVDYANYLIVSLRLAMLCLWIRLRYKLLNRDPQGLLVLRMCIRRPVFPRQTNLTPYLLQRCLPSPLRHQHLR